MYAYSQLMIINFTYTPKGSRSHAQGIILIFPFAPLHNMNSFMTNHHFSKWTKGVEFSFLETILEMRGIYCLCFYSEKQIEKFWFIFFPFFLSLLINIIRISFFHAYTTYKGF